MMLSMLALLKVARFVLINDYDKCGAAKDEYAATVECIINS